MRIVESVMVSHNKKRNAIGLDLTDKYYGSYKPYSAVKGRSEKTWKERKTVTIDRISESGNPIAETKHRDKHIHVPGARPGDTIEIAIEEDHGSFFKGFMIGPDGMSTREQEKEQERKKRKDKRKQTKEKRKQELEDWEKRKKKQKNRSGRSMHEIANRMGKCRSPQDSDANEDRFGDNSVKSDREKKIRERIGSKYN